MVSNVYKKVRTISVEEILKHNNKLYIEDAKKAEAIYELSNFLYEIAKKDSYQINGFVKILRYLKNPPISDNLASYIKSRSNRQLKKDVRRIILKEECSLGYSTIWTARENWVKVRTSFWKLGNFYYYNDKNFVNVFSIDEDDLPLYLNHKFNDKDQETYRKRLKKV